MKTLTYIFLLSFLSSCIPCYYSPSPLNVPMLHQKKDFRATVNLKMGVYTGGCDIQGAYAWTDHFGVMGNYSFYTTLYSPSDDTTLSGLNGHQVEGGLGYYLPFQERYVFEIYGGAGSSWIGTPTDNYYGFVSSKVHSWNLFLQPAIGIHKKNREFAFSTRFRMLDYDRVDIDMDGNGQIDEVLTDLEGLPKTYLIEPALIYRDGKGYMKYQIQLGFCFPINNVDYLEYDPVCLNLGMILTLRGEKKLKLPK